MNRTPRRPVRIQPPTRGRASATPPLGDTQHYTVPSVPKRPPSSGGSTRPFPSQPSYEEVDSGLPELYTRWSGLFKRLDTPWKWVLLLAILVALSAFAGHLI
jgi:hypothetical protein